MKEISLNVEGMKCEHCASRIKNVLLKLENISEVIINLEKKEVLIKHNNEIDINQIKELIEEEGYRVL